MTPRRFTSIAFSLVAFISAGERAVAEPTLNLDLTLASPGYTGSTVTFNLAQNGKTTNYNAYTGPYFFSVTSPPAGVGSTISTFCIDAPAGVNTASAASYTTLSLTNTNTTIYQNNPTKAQTVANALQGLYGEFYNTKWATLTGAQASNSTMYTAFQLALMELVYDGTSDLSNTSASNFFTLGNLTSSSSAAAEAQTMVSQVLNNITSDDNLFNSGLGENYSLVVLYNGSYQQQLWLQPNPGPDLVSTPVPPTLILGGIGLVGLIGRSRMKRPTSKSA